MTRSVLEWIGKTDDDDPPARVKRRVFERNEWKCQECGRHIPDGETPDCDHEIAIINGGKNRESNLRTLCELCHKKKTKRDMKLKAKTARIHARRSRKKGEMWQCGNCMLPNYDLKRERCRACGDYRND